MQSTLEESQGCCRRRFSRQPQQSIPHKNLKVLLQTLFLYHHNTCLLIKIQGYRRICFARATATITSPLKSMGVIEKIPCMRLHKLIHHRKLRVLSQTSRSCDNINQCPIGSDDLPLWQLATLEEAVGHPHVC